MWYRNRQTLKWSVHATHLCTYYLYNTTCTYTSSEERELVKKRRRREHSLLLLCVWGGMGVGVCGCGCVGDVVQKQADTKKECTCYTFGANSPNAKSTCQHNDYHYQYTNHRPCNCIKNAKQ